MSRHVLVLGQLIGSPIRRNGAKSDFGTATLRVATDDGSILVPVIAFGEITDRLLAHQQGQTTAVSGRSALRCWTGRDGTEKHGLSIIAETMASAASARRVDAERRSNRRDAAA